MKLKVDFNWNIILILLQRFVFKNELQTIVREKVKMVKVGKTMTLANLKIGTRAKVVRVTGKTAVTRRLMEMGVIPGVAVTVVKAAPFGDPIQIRVRGYSLAMRKSEAEIIEVSE